MKTVQMTAADVAARTARFGQLQAMSALKDNPVVPQAARDIFLARKIMPILLEQTQNACGSVAAIFGAAGLTMNISICPPDQGRACTRITTPTRPFLCSKVNSSFR